ncbi:hypothetical protein L6452_13406 [Arctium lappa]|uniref:Uncharacterized protein n=1 Tax=Arctium lappa TaxID=4217 RepID=A0ACB9CIH6_ARCLA|nr:hypothetical protein L6452_13406 [Arctium lappa]
MTGNIKFYRSKYGRLRESPQRLTTATPSPWVYDQIRGAQKANSCLSSSSRNNVNQQNKDVGGCRGFCLIFASGKSLIIVRLMICSLNQLILEVKMHVIWLQLIDLSHEKILP